MRNYNQLLKKIDKLPSTAKEYVATIKINNKNLFLIKGGCKIIRPELRIHYEKQEGLEHKQELFELVTKDKEIRNLLLSNIQYFFSEIRPGVISDSLEYNLSMIKRFGLIDPNQDYEAKKVALKLELKYYDDEGAFNVFLELSRHIFKDIRMLNKGFVKEKEFGKKVILPLIKILEILGLQENTHFETDKKYYLIIKDELLISEEGKELQNFFSCWQYHHFFEIYCNSLLEKEFKKEIIKNPIIFINPFWDKNKKIMEGYIELDGSLIISKDELIISESKNGYKVTQEFLTNLLGKSKLIECVYGIKVKCVLLSTGQRYNILKNIEDFPDIREQLIIKDREDYKTGFNFD